MRLATLTRTGPSALALFASACTTLPDTSGYTAATVQVKQSARGVGDVVAAEIAATADATDGKEAQNEIRQSGKQFDEAWGKTLGSLDAAVGYAESIEAIADAGNGGAESAQRVADAVSSLAEVLGVAGPAVGAAGTTGVILYRQIALIRAARSLVKALDAADPAILQLQELIQKQVATARDAFAGAMNAQDSELRIDLGLGFYARRDAQLEAEEKTRLAALADALLDPATRPAQVAPLKARVAAIHEARAALADGLARYAARRSEISGRRSAGLAVFKATDDAIAAWASAHAQLAVAVREHRPVTTASLLAAAEDLRIVVAKWRAL